MFSTGLNDRQISRLTGINRRTIFDWRHGRRTARRTTTCSACRQDYASIPSRSYAYLLGQYLGDGFVARSRKGVFALRIFSFSEYGQIISECVEAVSAVMPKNKVGVHPVPGVRLVVIQSYSKHWPCFFPQHGEGRKHERPIRLTYWQQSIVEHHPEAFIRGLIHSDGSRFINRVKHYEYPSYVFSNMSDDILRLFTNACDQLGIAWRRPTRKHVWISRRPAVAEMDTFVGPKT